MTGIVAKTAADNNKGTAPVATKAAAIITLTIGNNENINVYLPKWFDATIFNAWVALAAGDEVEATGFLANYKSNTTAWASDLHSGVQVVSPTIVKTVAAASVAKITPTMTVAGAVAAAKDTAVDTIGFYEGAYTTNMYNGVFLGDGAASIVTYKGANFPIGMKAGTPLRVVGKAAPYNGMPEIDISAGSITALPAAMVATTVLAPVVNTTVSAALAASDLNHQFTITDAVLKTITTAVVAGKTNGTYVVTIGSIDVTLYVNNSGLDASIYTALASAVAGGKLSFTAFGGQYYNKTTQVATYQLVAPQTMTFTPAA